MKSIRKIALSLAGLTGCLIVTVVMQGSFPVRLLFLVVASYLLLSSLWTKYGIFRDPFHPNAVYRLLLLVTMVFQVPILLGRETSLSEQTCIAILLTTMSFVVTMDVTARLAPGMMRIPTLDLRRGYYPALPKFFGLLYALGWLWRVYALSEGMLYGTYLATQLDSTHFSNIVGQMNNLAFVALLGFAIFRRSGRVTLLLYMMGLGEIAWGLIAGSKAAVLYTLLPLLFIYFHNREQRRLGVRSVAVGSCILILLLASFPVIHNYRIVTQQQVASGKDLSFATMIRAMEKTVSGLNDVNAVNDAFGELMERLNWAKFYGALLERPELLQNRWFGRSYLPIVVWWIPRAIWPGKPVVSVGAWYGREVLGWSYDSRSEGAITLWGDAVMNFGAVGIVGVQVAWIVLVFFIYRLGFAMGGWGFLFLASVYARLLLGLEQNMATALVAIQQTALLIAAIYLGVRVSAWPQRLVARSRYVPSRV